MKSHLPAIAVVAVLTACMQLEDPQAVSLEETFSIVPWDTVLPADGATTTNVEVRIDGRPKDEVRVNIETDAGRFAGASSPVSLAFAGRVASVLLVPDTVAGLATIRASIDDVTRYATVRFAPTSAGRLHIVPEKLSAVANGSDAITITVDVMPPATGQLVSRGQQVELMAFDSARIEMPEMRRLAVYRGSPVTFRLVSRYAGTTLVVARMGPVLSDTLDLAFKAEEAG